MEMLHILAVWCARSVVRALMLGAVFRGPNTTRDIEIPPGNRVQIFKRSRAWWPQRFT
jgi:hypothetical protein